MRSSLVSASALAVLAFAAGCGDTGDGRAVADLRSRLDSESTRVDELNRRLGALESENRGLEEQIAGLRMNVPPPRPGPAPAAGMPGPESPPADAAAENQAAEMAAILDTPEGQEKMRAFLAEEQKRKEDRQREERLEQMTRMLEDRVDEVLVPELNLTAGQRGTVVATLRNAMERVGEVWRSARDGGDPNAFATAREKMQTIRTESEEILQQALTVDQFEKYREIAGPSGMGLMGGRDGGFGGRGSGRTGGRGGDGGAGGNTRGR